MNFSLTAKNSFRRSENGRLLRRTDAARTRGDWGRCSPSRGTWPAILSSTPCRRGTCLPKIGTRHWSTCTRLVRATIAPFADPPHARTTWGTACSALCIQPVYSLFVPPRTQLLFRGDWMEQFQIAVSFLDRYLARNATERHELRGIALGCILMAAKVNGDELSVQEIAKIGCMHYRRVKVGCKKTPAILDSCYLAGNLKVTCVWLPSCIELREEGRGWSRMGWHRRHSTGTYKWAKIPLVHTSRLDATSAVVGWASLKLLYLW